MPQVLKIPKTKIITENGETTISISIEPIVIEVLVNVSSDGVVSIASAKKEEEIVEKNNWVLPSFSNEKIKFGKPG